MSRIRDLIAFAIKDADRSIFNEDYEKQAQVVIGALRRAGYEIVPREPSPKMVDETVANLPYGRMHQNQLVTALYQLMIDNSLKFPK